VACISLLSVCQRHRLILKMLLLLWAIALFQRLRGVQLGLQSRPRISDRTRIRRRRQLSRNSVGALGEMAEGIYRNAGATNNVLIAFRKSLMFCIQLTFFERGDK
jgi:hypothetical protein